MPAPPLLLDRRFCNSRTAGKSTTISVRRRSRCRTIGIGDGSRAGEKQRIEKRQGAHGTVANYKFDIRNSKLERAWSFFIFAFRILACRFSVAQFSSCVSQ